MNEIIRSLTERKSVRAFEDKALPESVRNAILQAAIDAPTAGNMTLYTILDITDQNLKDTLAVTCDNQPFIAKAPMVLVFCADYHRWYELFRRHVDEVRKPSYGDLLLANADALIAAQNCVVAAQSLGVGSCYIGDITENFERHRELLSLPSHVVPACMVVFGYPTQQQLNREKPRRFSREDIVFENTYDEERALSMEQMISTRQGIDEDEALEIWVRNFARRKWNSDFSVEMSRSCKEIIDYFCGED